MNKNNEGQMDSKSSAANAGSSAELQEEALEAVAATTEDDVATFKHQLEEQKNDYLRLAAEFDNYRKRMRRDMAEIVKSANESLIGDLLDVLDNFERAMKSAEEKPDFESFRKGVSLVYDKLSTILGNAGLKRFDSVGEPFDPRLHEAITQVDDSSKPADSVAAEFLPGYYLNDKVIRHAKVSVVKPDAESK